MSRVRDWFKLSFPINLEAVKESISEPIPIHLKRWWWCLGGIPAYLFIVQAITGILLCFHYVPSSELAYQSVKKITEVIPYGWYIRSVHRWSATFMIVTVILHMMRVFFTGSYRKPRELNWIAGVALLFLTLLFGFTGYSLIYEQLSYWGMTVAGNLTEAVPLIGSYLADFIRGGESVGTHTLTRFFTFHIWVLPALLMLVLGLHLLLIRLHGVTEFEFEDKDKNQKTKTFPFYPNHILTEVGLGVGLMFVITILSIVFPAELGEPANPLVTPPHIKPEWYFFFTFRWLKLTSLTFAVLSLGFAAFMLFLWPFIDRLLRRKNKDSELSVIFGVIGVVALVVLTVWEALSILYSH